ncbi:hypothetical protein BDB00DRAFT_551519 [Zychaea mexicana]|uniref:uncharacterized protein n=1 Tax=Zychaea mexicana TaxID=64656 RepID=UPI0022FDFAA4|nr:uncharacterized protein BDB00DRAFT_551519 [Zychaea mexicana]KAI9490491.1 hypothetical protein BDB00DRAFT_551519 [Zychaea mexicana]
MYITYNARQWRERMYYKSDDSVNITYPKVGLTGPHDSPPQRFHQLPKSTFIPTWLVRISDMTVVPGSTASEGYCALSYSWNQSGDTIIDKNTGKAKRVDEGKHRIIFPAKTVRKKPRGRKRIGRKVKFVKFEGILQQMCNDFGIKYLWFDQMCINQDDPQAKHQEIHLMHNIYSNAYCTVVLLPEIRTLVSRMPGTRTFRIAGFSERSPEPEWLQRLWTFEEALQSRKMLFVGRDVHSWSDVQRTNVCGPLYHLCMQPLHSDASWWNACNTLHHAHNRKTTKDHDRVFALGIMFPDILKGITVDYKLPLSDLLVQFYALLAKSDLSVLCFGEARSEKNPMQKYNLPSWTGASGTHLQGRFFDTENSVAVVDIDGQYMHVTCTSVISKMLADTGEDPRSWTYDDLPPIPGHLAEEEFVIGNLVIYVQLPGHKKRKVVNLSRLVSFEFERRSFAITPELQLLALLIPLKKENLFWWTGSLLFTKEVASISFSLTEDESDQGTAGDEGGYAILSGIQFHSWHDRRFPVIQKEGQHYKAIGTCRIKNSEYFFADYTATPETFVIK